MEYSRYNNVPSMNMKHVGRQRRLSKIYYDSSRLLTLKAQCHLLSDVILRLRNNVTIMYFDRYLSCFGIKIQIIPANLYKLKIRHKLQILLWYNKPH